MCGLRILEAGIVVVVALLFQMENCNISCVIITFNFRKKIPNFARKVGGSQPARPNSWRELRQSPWRERAARAYNRGLGAEPPAGSRAKPPETESFFVSGRYTEQPRETV